MQILAMGWDKYDTKVCLQEWLVGKDSLVYYLALMMDFAMTLYSIVRIT